MQARRPGTGQRAGTCRPSVVEPVPLPDRCCSLLHHAAVAGNWTPRRSHLQPLPRDPYLVSAAGLLANNPQIAAASSLASAGTPTRPISPRHTLGGTNRSSSPPALVRSAPVSPAAWGGSPAKSLPSPPTRPLPATPAGSSALLDAPRTATPSRGRFPAPIRARVHAAPHGTSPPATTLRSPRSLPAAAVRPLPRRSTGTRCNVVMPRRRGPVPNTSCTSLSAAAVAGYCSHTATVIAARYSSWVITSMPARVSAVRPFGGSLLIRIDRRTGRQAGVPPVPCAPLRDYTNDPTRVQGRRRHLSAARPRDHYPHKAWKLRSLSGSAVCGRPTTGPPPVSQPKEIRY